MTPGAGASLASPTHRALAALGTSRPGTELSALSRLLWRLGRGLVRVVAQRRFPVEEYIRQTWYAIGACTLPALAASIPSVVERLVLPAGALSRAPVPRASPCHDDSLAVTVLL